MVVASGSLWATPLALQVILGQEFFDEITTAAVPVDLRALRLLRSSPMALDIYSCLTYLLSCLRRTRLVLRAMEIAEEEIAAANERYLDSS